MPAIHRSTFACTTHTADRGAFERWKTQVWVTHDVNELSRHHGSMNCTAHQIGPLLISQTTGYPARRERTPTHIRRDHFDHYALYIQQEGRCTTEVNTTRSLLEPGDIQIIDLAQPETVTTTGGANTTFYVARDPIDAAIPEFHLQHGHILKGPAARQLTSFITSLPTYVQAIPEQGLPGFVDAAMTYVLTALMEHQHADFPGSSPRASYLRQEIISYIDLHLSDPNLSPGSVSEVMGLSRSALYRLFPMEGGIARLIRIRRLRRVRRAIQNETDRRPISQISSDFGFTSATQFWRAFRQEYGYPPGDLRTQPLVSHRSPTPTSLATLLHNVYQAPVTRPVIPTAMSAMWSGLS